MPMLRALALLVTAVTLAACGGPGKVASPVAAGSVGPTGSPGSDASIEPTSRAAATPAGPAPEPTAVVDPTLEPTLTHPPVPCPTTSPMTVLEFVHADRSCFGGADVEVRAWLDTPQVMGWLPPVVKPGWLFYPPDARYTALFDAPPMDPEHICAVDVPECTWFFAHLEPGSEIVLEGPARWVIATGHRDDPAAERCHYVESSVAPGPHDDAPVREACRDHFVLIAIEDAPGP